MRENLRKLTKKYQKYYDNSSTESINTSNFDSSSVSLSTSQSECNEFLQDQSLLPFEDIVELHKQKKYTSAFPLFQQYAACSHRKSPLAKFYCGYYLYHGKFGINKDEDSAIEYLHQAADAQVVKAQTLYAEACLEGSTYDPINGIKYLKKAVKHEDRAALEMWAEILYNGEHDHEINLKEAFNIWKKAASKGSKLKLFDENQENQENQKNRENRDEGYFRNILIVAAPIILVIFLIIFYD
jgi:TPR repeat protein